MAFDVSQKNYRNTYTTKTAMETKHAMHISAIVEQVIGQGYVVPLTLSSTNCKYRPAMARNIAPEATPKTVRRMSTRGSNILATAQNMMLPRLNTTVPPTEYMTRHDGVTSCM